MRYLIFAVLLSIIFQRLDAYPSIQLSGNTQTFFEGQTNFVIDSLVQINDTPGNTMTAARVLINSNFDSTADSLVLIDDPGDNITVNYDSSIGVLYLDGSDNIENYQAALRQVEFSNSNAVLSVDKDLTMSLGDLLAFKGPDHSSYHYYEYIASNKITWTNANLATNALVHFGIQGYLITITSEEENSFALTKFKANAWIGAGDPTTEGDWYWLTGPEAGSLFWQGESTGSSQNGFYENWANGEPNDFKNNEDYAHFWQSQNGKWNDFRVDNTSIAGYLVEYGGLEASPPTLVDSVVTTVLENSPPSSITLASNTIDEGGSVDFINAFFTGINVNVTDPDITAGHPTEFTTTTLLSTTLYPDNANFTLTSNILKVLAPFDFETQNTYTLGIQATDSFGNSYSQDVLITIGDVNESPTISQGIVSVTMNEDDAPITQTVTFSDSETISDNLTVDLISGNTELLASANLTLSGTGGTRTVTIEPTLNAFGSGNMTLRVTDEGGLSTEIPPNILFPVVLTVNAVNDAPIHSSVNDITVTEDTDHIFLNDYLVSDVDIGSSNLQIFLSVGQGSLSLGSTANLNFSLGNGTNDNAMIFTGNLTDTNLAFASVTYHPLANDTGSDNIIWTSSDQGATGLNGTMLNGSIIEITISPINDAPILHAQDNLYLNAILEDSSPTSGNSWSELRGGAAWTAWEDYDSGDPASIAVIASDNQSLGIWEYSQNGGLTWTSLPNVTVNSALLLDEATRFRINLASDANGSANLSIKAWDQSDSHSVGDFVDTTIGSSFSTNTLVLIQNIDAVNDGPFFSLAASADTDEDVSVTLGTITLNDVDLGSATANIHLVSPNGNLTLATNTNLTFELGDGNLDNEIKFSANLQATNDALNGILFTPFNNYNGTTFFTLSANDLGNIGQGGALTSNTSQLVLVEEENDAPTLNTLLDLGWDDKTEDILDPTGNTLSELLTAISVNTNAYDDIDETVPNSINLPDGMAITFWSSDNGQWQTSFNNGGSWANFPTYDGRSLLLRDDGATSIRFFPNTHYYGVENITIRSWDGTESVSGNLFNITTTGTNTSFSNDQSQLTLTINPINDAPYIQAPTGTLSLTEDVSYSFSSSNQIILTDIESTDGELTLSVSSGNLSLSQTTGITFIVGTGTSDANLTIQGNLSDLNNAINNLSLTPTPNYTGQSNLFITYNDQDTTENNPILVDQLILMNWNNINDTPTLTNLDASLTYTEGSNLLVSANLTVIDIDDTFVETAQIAITQGWISNDELSVTLNGNISSSYSNGNLVLTGKDTLANYQTTIRSLQFSNSSEDPDEEGSNLQRTLSFRIFDAESASSIVVMSLQIQSDDDAPVISSWDTTPHYNEDDASLILDSDVTISDIDSSQLTQVTLDLSPFVTGDTLSVSTSTNLSTSYNSGRLTLTGPASISDFEQSLQSLNYISTSVDPDSQGAAPTRDIDLTITDGSSSTNISITLSVNSINDTPIIQGPSPITFTEDNAISPNFTISDIDAFSATNLQLQLSASYGTIHTLSGSSNNLSFTGSLVTLQNELDQLSYTPESDFNGQDVLSLKLYDRGNFGTDGEKQDSYSLSLTVTPENDAPTLVSDALSLPDLQEDESDSSGLSVNNIYQLSGNQAYADVDQGAGIGVAIYSSNHLSSWGEWQYSLNQGGSWKSFPTLSANASLLLEGENEIRFVPANDFYGTVSLDLRAWDRSSGHQPGDYGVLISTTGGNSSFSSNTSSWFQTVTPVNDAPFMTLPSSISMEEDSFSSTSNIIISDIESGGNYTLAIMTTDGTLSLNNGSTGATLNLNDTLDSINTLLAQGLTFTSQLNFNGFTTVSFLLTDPDGASYQDQWLIAVNAVNDAPTLDTSIWVTTLQLNEDESDSEGWTPSWLASNLISALDDVDLIGSSNSFDQLGLVFTDLGSDIDGVWQVSYNDGGSWQDVTLTGGNALHLSMSVQNLLRFIPEADANGNTTLSIRAWDRTQASVSDQTPILNTGGTSAYSLTDHQINLEIKAINDAPVIFSKALPQIFMEDETLTFRADLDNSLTLADIDLGDEHLVELELSAGQGTLEFSNLDDLEVIVSDNLKVSGNLTALNSALDGLTYTPNSNYFGQDQITLLIDDLGQIGDNALTHEISLALEIQAINDAPVLSRLDGDSSTYTENSVFISFDSGESLTIEDVDSDDFDSGRIEVIGEFNGTKNDEISFIDESDLSKSSNTLLYQGNVIALWEDNSSNSAEVSIFITSDQVDSDLAERILRNLRYKNNSEDPSSETRSFNINLYDGDGDFDSSNVRIKVEPINDDPELILTATTALTIDEDSVNWKPLENQITIHDLDSSDFNEGQILIQSIQNFEQDGSWSLDLPSDYSLSDNLILYQGQTLGILNNFSEETTLFDFSSTSNISSNIHFTTILESLAFSADDQSPYEDLRSWEVFIFDGDGGVSAVQMLTFSVNPINDAPILSNGLSLSIGSILEDTVDPTSLAITDLIDIENNFISDVDGTTSFGAVITLLYDTSTDGTWQWRRSNGDWNEVAFNGDGIQLGPNDHLRFLPLTNYFGTLTESLNFRAWDRSENRTLESVSITNTGGNTAYSVNTRDLNFEVEGTPDAPSLTDFSGNVAKYAYRSILWTEFESVFSDVDGDSLQSITLLSLPSNGNLLIDGVLASANQIILSTQQLIYTPLETYTGNDQFSFSASDGVFDSTNSSNLNLDILPIDLSISLSQNTVNESESSLLLSLSLSTTSTQDVSVDLSVIPGSLGYQIDYFTTLGNLVIPAGSLSLQNSITIIDDLYVEGSENIQFLLSDATFADLSTTHTVLTVEDNDQTISGDDIESNGIILRWLTPPWVSENGDHAVLELSLENIPTENISLILSLSDESEASVNLTELTFTPTNNANTPQSIIITGLDDTLLDGLQSFALIIESSITSLPGEIVELHNRDNDVQGFSVITPVGTTLSEDGGQITVLIQLNQEPSSTVTLSPLFDNNDMQLSSSNLIFTTANWDTPQVLIIDALDNNIAEGDRVALLNWSPAESLDINLNGLRPPALNLSIVDDDTLVSNTDNRPPYRLVLNSDIMIADVLELVTLSFDAEDPELIDGLRGGIVSYQVIINDQGLFVQHSSDEAGSFGYRFKKAGPVELTLIAKDLHGALSTKTLHLLIESQSTTPFTQTTEVQVNTAPWTHSLDLNQEIIESNDRQSIFWDGNGDGIYEIAFLDGAQDTITQSYDDSGQYTSRLAVLMETGEVFIQEYPVYIRNDSQPDLSLTVTTSQNEAPLTLQATGSINNLNSTLSYVEWNIGLNEEFETHHITSDFNLDISYQKPGSHILQARLFFNDGSQHLHQSQIHIPSPDEPYILIHDLLNGENTAELANSHPLTFGVWPPQASLINPNYTLNQSSFTMGDQLVSVNASENITFMTDSYFDNETFSLSSNLQVSISNHLNAANSDDVHTTYLRKPWDQNYMQQQVLTEGSGALLPAVKGITGEQITVSLLGKSGLNLQGVPEYLNTLNRDVNFSFSANVEFSEPNTLIELQLAYDDIDQDNLIDNTTVHENNLVAMRFDKELNRWVNVESFYTHPEKNIVRVKTAHLSTFGLFIPETRTLPQENSSGGGCLLK